MMYFTTKNKHTPLSTGEKYFSTSIAAPGLSLESIKKSDSNSVIGVVNLSFELIPGNLVIITCGVLNDKLQHYNREKYNINEEI